MNLKTTLFRWLMEFQVYLMFPTVLIYVAECVCHAAQPRSII